MNFLGSLGVGAVRKQNAVKPILCELESKSVLVIRCVGSLLIANDTKPLIVPHKSFTVVGIIQICCILCIALLQYLLTEWCNKIKLSKSFLNSLNHQITGFYTNKSNPADRSIMLTIDDGTDPERIIWSAGKMQNRKYAQKCFHYGNLQLSLSFLHLKRL